MSTTGSADMATYQDFLKNVQPVEVGLVSASANFDRKLFATWVNSEDHKIAHVVNAHYDLDDVGEASFDVTARLSVKTRVGDRDGDEVLSIESVHFARFESKIPLSKTDAGRFAKAEARLILWPFLREFVASTTGRMGVPALTLPLVLRSEDGEDKPASNQSRPASVSGARKKR